MAAVTGLDGVARYDAFRPVRSLKVALKAMCPDLVVPCDERVVADLHALHALEPAEGDLRRLIERSLGAPARYATTLSRAATLGLAAADHIAVPETRLLLSEADVLAWCREQPLPSLLKTDGSWGGAGVTLVRGPEAALAAFRRMSKPLATWRAAKFLLSNRDPFPAAEWWRRERSPVTAQAFVEGSPANIMVACWEGRVLASASAKVLDTAKQFGAATIIRLADHTGMESAADRLVRRLGLSGFCGLDFVIDANDDAHLIELNPRATQLGHLMLPGGSNLAEALFNRLRDAPETAVIPPAIVPDTVALFPQAWLSESASSWLPSAYLDIPWDEPGLVAELRRRPWEKRSPLARATDIVLRRPNPAHQLAGCLTAVPTACG